MLQLVSHDGINKGDSVSFDRDAFLREVGLRMQVVRKSRGLTQEDVAGTIGVSRATYASIERGRQRATIDLLWKIAVTLSVAISDLFPEPLVNAGTQSNLLSRTGLLDSHSLSKLLSVSAEPRS